MPERTLQDWLAWMEAHHPRQIDLGLERVGRVAARLGLRFAQPVISVGGTNGKGSCVAFLEAILRAAGYRVGAYTSPHLLRYNERVRIDGDAVDDASLCAAFSAVADALGDTSLTYFEFGTLAALWLFRQAPLDVVILEVGLGGRLDAVNLIDADVAVLTTIDLDHQDWLGSDRDTIGFEKAGIFRPGKAAICADPAPPPSVAAQAQRIGAHWLPLGSAFSAELHEQSWDWRGDGLPRPAVYRDLPLPRLPWPSAAAALAALHCVELAIGEDAIRAGLAAATLPGRFQRLPVAGAEVIVDVAHNPQAARWLAARLAELPRRHTAAVFAIMADKDADGVIDALRGHIDAWYLGDLAGNARALPAAALAQRLRAAGVVAPISVEPSVQQAYAAATAHNAGARVLVFGSFFTVATVLEPVPPQH